MIAPISATVGQTVTVEGYADDYGKHIAGVEFSLDGGATWVRQDTSASNPDLSVHWTFSFVPERAGTYRLQARSISDDGRRSPLAASVDVFVDEP